MDWTGSESSDTPAPTIEAVSSFGGSSSTLSIIALIVGGIGVVLGIVAADDQGRGRSRETRAALLAAGGGGGACAARSRLGARGARADRAVGEQDGEHARRAQVLLTYSEPIEPRFAIVSVTDAAGPR